VPRNELRTLKHEQAYTRSADNLHKTSAKLLAKKQYIMCNDDFICRHRCMLCIKLLRVPVEVVLTLMPSKACVYVCIRLCTNTKSFNIRGIIFTVSLLRAGNKKYSNNLLSVSLLSCEANGPVVHARHQTERTPCVIYTVNLQGC
jgi:hypothetical protein